MSSSILIGDAWFKQYPKKVLGTTILKKRGDRGADAVEEIVQGTLDTALLEMSFMLGDLSVNEPIKAVNNSNELERLRLKDISLKMKLDLLELELSL